MERQFFVAQVRSASVSANESASNFIESCRLASSPADVFRNPGISSRPFRSEEGSLQYMNPLSPVSLPRAVLQSGSGAPSSSKPDAPHSYDRDDLDRRLSLSKSRIAELKSGIATTPGVPFDVIKRRSHRLELTSATHERDARTLE